MLTHKELHDELIEATETLSNYGLSEATKPDLHWAKKLRDVAEEYIEAFEVEINLVDADIEDDEELDVDVEKEDEEWSQALLFSLFSGLE